MQMKKQRRNQTKMIVRNPGMHSARTDLNWTLVFPGAQRAAQRVGADERCRIKSNRRKFKALCAGIRKAVPQMGQPFCLDILCLDIYGKKRYN